MKNLLAFTAFLAAGYLLGSRRARKAGPIEQICIEVKADTAQAVTALKELQAQAVKTIAVAADFNLRGSDLVALGKQEEFRREITLEPDRATGQTTRLVDAAIQTLFSKGEVLVRDHVNVRAAHVQLFEKVVARLKLEHSRDLFVFDDRHFKVLLSKHCRAYRRLKVTA